MNKKKLIQEIKNIENAKRDNRQRVASLVSENIDLMTPLVDLTFMVNDKISIRAAWILEWICTHDNLDLILPYLDTFTNEIKGLQFDSALRPCAKICEHLAKAYTHKKETLVKKTLKEYHIEKIIETGFDWLITPQKIAVKAYTMNTLFLFGLTRDWIHPELSHLISTKIIHQSKGCKARGRHILLAIEKHKKEL